MPRLPLAALLLFAVLACGRKAPSPPAGPPTRSEFVPDDAPRLTPKHVIQLPGARVGGGGTVSADGSRVAASCNGPDGTVTQVWDVSAAPKLLAEVPGQLEALSPSGSRLFVSPGRVVDLSGAVLATPKPDSLMGLPAVAFQGEDRLVGVSRDVPGNPAAVRVVVWDIPKDGDAGSFDAPGSFMTLPRPIKGGREMWLFVNPSKSPGTPRSVQVCDVAAGKVARSLPGPADKADWGWASFTHLAADGSVFVNAPDIAVEAYDGTTGQHLRTLPRSFMRPEGFIGTRPWLIGGFEPKLAQREGWTWSDRPVLDLTTDKVVAVLTGLTSDVHNEPFAASADGKTLAASAEDGSVRVFDLSALK